MRIFTNTSLRYTRHDGRVTKKLNNQELWHSLANTCEALVDPPNALQEDYGL